jgi:hypothetical protein
LLELPLVSCSNLISAQYRNFLTALCQKFLSASCQNYPLVLWQNVPTCMCCDAQPVSACLPFRMPDPSVQNSVWTRTVLFPCKGMGRAGIVGYIPTR